MMKKLERSFMNVMSTVTPGKKCSIFHYWPVIFSKFDKCDLKSHLYKVTGRNLTGLFFYRPITVARLPSTNSTMINDIISQICFKNLEWTIYTCIQGVDDDSKAD